ncbi:MAG: hypothetical protein ACRCZZ_08080 [Phocaeicola sp.]
MYPIDLWMIGLVGYPQFIRASILVIPEGVIVLVNCLIRAYQVFEFSFISFLAPISLFRELRYVIRVTTILLWDESDFFYLFLGRVLFKTM